VSFYCTLLLPAVVTAVYGIVSVASFFSVNTMIIDRCS